MCVRLYKKYMVREFYLVKFTSGSGKGVCQTVQEVHGKWVLFSKIYFRLWYRCVYKRYMVREFYLVKFTSGSGKGVCQTVQEVHGKGVLFSKIYFWLW